MSQTFDLSQFYVLFARVCVRERESMAANGVCWRLKKAAASSLSGSEWGNGAHTAEVKMTTVCYRETCGHCKHDFPHLCA